MNTTARWRAGKKNWGSVRKNAGNDDIYLMVF